jgi:hypothetical protein
MEFLAFLLREAAAENHGPRGTRVVARPDGIGWGRGRGAAGEQVGQVGLGCFEGLDKADDYDTLMVWLRGYADRV